MDSQETLRRLQRLTRLLPPPDAQSAQSFCRSMWAF
jgi:hypothetical protein